MLCRGCKQVPLEKRNLIPQKIDKTLLDAVQSSTKLTCKEIKALYKRFRKIAPHGFMDYPKFREILGIIGSIDETFLSYRLFDAFDINQDGYLDFSEFAITLGIMIRGSDEEKLDLSFRIIHSPISSKAKEGGAHGDKRDNSSIEGGASNISCSFEKLDEQDHENFSRAYERVNDVHIHNLNNNMLLCKSRDRMSVRNKNAVAEEYICLEEFVKIVKSIDATRNILVGSTNGVSQLPSDEDLERIFYSLASSDSENNYKIFIEDFKYAVRHSAEFLILLGVIPSQYTAESSAQVPAFSNVISRKHNFKSISHILCDGVGDKMPPAKQGNFFTIENKLPKIYETLKEIQNEFVVLLANLVNTSDTHANKEKEVNNHVLSSEATADKISKNLSKLKALGFAESTNDESNCFFSGNNSEKCKTPVGNAKSNSECSEAQDKKLERTLLVALNSCKFNQSRSGTGNCNLNTEKGAVPQKSPSFYYSSIKSLCNSRKTSLHDLKVKNIDSSFLLKECRVNGQSAFSEKEGEVCAETRGGSGGGGGGGSGGGGGEVCAETKGGSGGVGGGSGGGVGGGSGGGGGEVCAETRGGSGGVGEGGGGEECAETRGESGEGGGGRAVAGGGYMKKLAFFAEGSQDPKRSTAADDSNEIGKRKKRMAQQASRVSFYSTQNVEGGDAEPDVDEKQKANSSGETKTPGAQGEAARQNVLNGEKREKAASVLQKFNKKEGDIGFAGQFGILSGNFFSSCINKSDKNVVSSSDFSVNNSSFQSPDISYFEANSSCISNLSQRNFSTNFNVPSSSSHNNSQTESSSLNASEIHNKQYKYFNIATEAERVKKAQRKISSLITFIEDDTFLLNNNNSRHNLVPRMDMESNCNSNHHANDNGDETYSCGGRIRSTFFPSCLGENSNSCLYRGNGKNRLTYMYMNRPNFEDRRKERLRRNTLMPSTMRTLMKKSLNEFKLLGPTKGLAVHFGHESWDMVLDMMIGIRLAAVRANSESKTKLENLDFYIKEKFNIKPRLKGVSLDKCEKLSHQKFSSVEKEKTAAHTVARKNIKIKNKSPLSKNKILKHCTSKQNDKMNGFDSNAPQSRHKNYLKENSSNTLKSSVCFVDYAPLVFRKLREYFGISAEDYYKSVGPEQLLGNMVLGNLSSLSELVSEGKSGEFFYYTADGKFMIKTVPKDTANFMRGWLRDYYLHCMKNPNTLITRFYGFHAIRFKKKNRFNKQIRRLMKTTTSRLKLYFIVMGNVFHTPVEIHRRYDLKGSWVGRSLEPHKRNDPTIALKDLDLDEMGDKIEIGKEKATLLKNQMKDDCEFLKNHLILDYSLLMGIHYREKSCELDLLEVCNTEEIKNKDETIDAVSEKCLTQKTSSNNNNNDNEKDESFYFSFNNFRKSIPIHQRDFGGLLSTDSNKLYYLGIIDISTRWNMKKKLENLLRSIQTGVPSGISCVHPNVYAGRFLNFINKRIE